MTALAPTIAIQSSDWQCLAPVLKTTAALLIWHCHLRAK